MFHFLITLKNQHKQLVYAIEIQNQLVYIVKKVNNEFKY